MCGKVGSKQKAIFFVCIFFFFIKLILWDRAHEAVKEKLSCSKAIFPQGTRMVVQNTELPKSELLTDLM